MDDVDDSYWEIANAVAGAYYPDYFQDHCFWCGVRVQLLWLTPSATLDIYITGHVSWGLEVYELEVHESAGTAFSAVLGWFQRVSAFLF